jgi:hypothetical protein
MQLARALAFCALGAGPVLAQGSSILSQKPVQELRGAWISASDGVFASQVQISKAMEALADARFDVVFPCVWDGAYTLWHSPAAKEAFGADCDPACGDRDLLSEILFEAHRFGLEVVPWFEAGFTAKGALLDKHPEWAALGKDGKPLSLGGERWVDALNPAAQQFYFALVLELARNFDIDGIAGSERFPALPAEAAAKPAQLELYKKSSGGAAPSDAKDPKWCAWRAQQLSDFLARISGGLRPSLAIVMVPRAAGAADWLQDFSAWSEHGCAHALVLPAAQASAGEWCEKHKDKLFAGLAANSATSAAALAAHRQQKLAGEVFSGCKALLENDAALAKALADGPYGLPAIPPWRSEEGWRPKPIEARPQAGSGRWTFADSQGPMVMTLTGGLKGEASWSARARLAGVYAVYTWIPPDQSMGETAKYQLGTKRGLETKTLHVGPLSGRGWRYLGEVNLPESEEFEVARFDATEKDATKTSAIGPLLLLYDRLASRP